MGKSKGRASSSGLAASLLPDAQGAAVPAVGFGGYHGASRVEPAALPTSDDPDAPVRLPPDVDGEVLQHLRRLGRKDPTTKLKALSTLSMLFAQQPADQVVQIVPQWAAFPQSDRRLDALVLCVKETFVYLNENLKLTTQALSDKVTPTDELEDMHQRACFMALSQRAIQ